MFIGVEVNTRLNSNLTDIQARLVSRSKIGILLGIF